MRSRRVDAGVVALALIVVLGWAALVRGTGDAEAGAQATNQRGTQARTVARLTADVAGKRKPASVIVAKEGRPSDKTRLELAGVVTGNLSPKSVASSGAGYVTAQDMMYRHTVTVYDARTLKLVKTISDAVNLRRLGYPQYPGTSRGAPVEAAFSPDGRYAYVSDYSMYWARFRPEGSGSCTPSSGYDRSFVYRIDMKTLKIDAAYRVGAVPKVVAVTPDDRYGSSRTGARGI